MVSITVNTLVYIKNVINQLPLYKIWLMMTGFGCITIVGFKNQFETKELILTLALLTSSLLIPTIILVYKQDIFYAGVIFWAVLAIGMKQRIYETFYLTTMINNTLVSIGFIWAFIHLIKELVEEYERQVITFIKEKSQRNEEITM